MMKGKLVVPEDLDIRRLADPIPATVGGQPVAIAREMIPDGVKVGDIVRAIPLLGTAMVAIEAA